MDGFTDLEEKIMVILVKERKTASQTIADATEIVALLEADNAKLRADADRFKDLVIERDKSLSEALNQRDTAELQVEALQNENAKLKRHTKCSGCGHSKENHEYSGCLVWVDADAGRKCLCKGWTDIEKVKGD